MSVQVECPRCKKQWYGVKKGGGEICTKCGQKIPTYDRIYRLRQRVRQPDGTVVQHTKYLGRVYKEEAEKLAFEAKAAAKKHISLGEVVDGPKRLTWRELIETYLRKLEIEGRSAKYQHNSRLYLERMGAFWGFDLPVDKLTKDMFQEFRFSLMQERSPSQSTVDLHHAVAKAAWQYSLPDTPNPFKSIKLFNPRNEVTRYLSKDQRDRLLQVALGISRDLAAIIYIALTTGLRKGNVLELRRDEVDFEKGLITVIQKGGRTHSISIGSSVMQVLRSIPDNGTPWFWVGPNGTPYNRDWRRPWNKAKKLAGIPDDFRFHDLRHDAGTSILRETGSLKLAQEALGHRDIKTTQRYAHVMQEQMRAAIESISPDFPLDASVPPNVPPLPD